MLFRDDNPVLSSATFVDNQSTASGAGPGQVGFGTGGMLPKVQMVEMVQSTTLSAASTSQTLFVFPKDLGQYGQYMFSYAIVSFGTTSTSGTLQIERATGTQAIGGGTALLQATLSLSGTANTPVDSTGSSAPIAATNSLIFNGGDRLNILLAGTLTGLANCVVTVVLKRV